MDSARTTFQAMPKKVKVVNPIAAAAQVLTDAARIGKAGYNLTKGVERALPRLGITSGTKPKPAAQNKMTGAVAPVSYGTMLGHSSYTITNQTPTVTTVRGHTFLGPVTQKGTGTNDVAFVTSLNPTTFSDRLSVFARTFDKYVYKNVTAHYRTASSTGTAGTVFMYFERDVDDAIVTPDNGPGLMSQEAATLGPVWQNNSATIKRDPTELRTYFTGQGNGIELRDVEQFRLVVATQGVTSPATLGNIVITYELDLVAPVFYTSEQVTVPLMLRYTTSTGNMGFAANSNSSSGFPPFGITGTGIEQIILFEIIIASLGTTTTTVNGNFKFGAGGPNLFLAPGTTLYLTQQGGSLNQSTGGYLYTNFMAAMKADTAQAIYNNTVTQNLFNNNVTVIWRAIASVNPILS